MYLIVQCSSCGNVIIAKKGQKTKRCTYCTTRLNVLNLKTLFVAANSFEASKVARKIKEKMRI